MIIVVKPCPECGCDRLRFYLNGDEHRFGGQVKCPKCGKLGPYKPSKIWAALAWNREMRR